MVGAAVCDATGVALGSLVGGAPVGMALGSGTGEEITRTTVKVGIAVTNAGTLGSFDSARLQRLIDITKPIFAAQKVDVPQGIKPDDVATDRFIDPKIGLPS